MPAVARAAPWIARLRAFVAPAELENEACDLCGAPLSSAHPHVAEPAQRRLLCTCPACAVLFPDAASGRYRRVPSATVELHDFMISDTQWEALGIPVGLAFFFYSTADGRHVALYPGPGGATSSGLDVSAWSDVAAANPRIADLCPDVEAVLVNRVGGAREYYRVPIDRCYMLIGTIRRRWRGLGGGAEVEQVLRDFRREVKGGDGEGAHA